MSEISKQALKVDNSQSFPDNNAGAITPSDLRAFNVNMIDSLVDEIGYTADSASWNNSITGLNTFTASQQPTFNALNQFTASQLTINTGVNAFTWSANARLNATESEIDQLQTWSGSVNEIRFNNVFAGYSTRLNFGGFLSASMVQNVNGTIADIIYLQDPTKLNTSSFNEYTASTAATQSVFSASVATSISQSSAKFNAYTASTNAWTASAQASITELLNLSSSLSGGYATQGELDAVSSSLNSTINSVSASLVNTIDTKTNTSSFNAFTQSQNNLNVTFATTGSNVFLGDQIISGTFTQSGSNSLPGGPGGQTAGTHIQNRVLISGPSTGDTPRLWISGSDGAIVEIARSFITIDATKQPAFGASTFVASDAGNSSNNTVAVYNSDFSVDSEIQMFANSSSIGLADWDNGSTFNYVPFMTLTPNLGDNPSPVFTRALKSVGTTILTGSIQITGSALGNVVPLTISSQTASMDLSKGNFFTLTLASGSITHLTTTNIAQGQTINLLVSQPNNATGSLTYNSTIKFPAGNGYIATPFSSSKDIITFITFDNSTIYGTSINNLA